MADEPSSVAGAPAAAVAGAPGDVTGIPATDADGHGGVAGARRIAANSVIQAGGEAGSKVAMLVLYAVMARELGQQDFGDFTSAASLALLVLVAGFGVDFTTTKLVARGDVAAGDAFRDSVTTKVGLGVLVIAAVVGVAAIGGYDRQVVIGTALLGLATLIELVTMSVHAVLRGVERTGPIAQGQLLQRSATAFLGIAALTQGAGLVVVALIWIACATIGLLFTLSRALRIGAVPHGRRSAAGARAVLRDSFGLGLSSVFGAALSRLDVIILGLLQPATAVALYGASYRLFESCLFVVATFAFAAFPMLSRIGPDDRAAMGVAYGRVLKVLVVTTAPMVLALTLFADPIIELVYGPQYVDAVSGLQLLAPAILFTGAFTMTCNVLAALGRQRAVVAGLLVGAACNAGLNLALVPPHAEDGAALAMSLSMALTAGLLFVLARRATGPVLVVRATAGPLVASAAAVAAVLALGDALAVLPVAMAVYAGVLVLAERSLFPADFRAVRQVLVRRSVS
ncbi:flippase [Patulibacter sp.]|uniref:flippase n=1 Tax=Patulibacter sp. TaxID=1912859 RepID=UPI00272269B1|nr:flippase [Patulibacter sp.]MDO9407675.1 flippase [Patulibacter sp.]